MKRRTFPSWACLKSCAVVALLTIAALKVSLSQTSVFASDTLDVAPGPTIRNVNHVGKVDGSVWPGGDPNPYPDILLQTWRSMATHPSGRDPRLAPLTCRIFHACRSTDGTILLPDALRNRKVLLQLCGVAKYVFSGQRVTENTTFHHEDFRFDFISPEVEPTSIDGTALISFYTKLIYIQQIVTSKQPQFDMDFKFYGDKGETGNSTSSSLRSQIAVQPLIFDSEFAALESFMSQKSPHGIQGWKSRMLELLANAGCNITVRTVPRDYVAGLDIGIAGDRFTCFKSVLSSGESGNDLPPEYLKDSNQFFAKNNLSRVRNHADVNSVLQLDPAGTIILNETEEASYKSGMTLPQKGIGLIKAVVAPQGLVYEQIASIIERLHKQMAVDQKYVLDVLELADDMDAKILQSVFNDADIVIAASKPLLSNIVFMRANAIVVELLPYSIDDDFYMKYARQLGIFHVSFMTVADSTQFELCLRAYITLSLQEFQTVMDMWADGVEKFDRGQLQSHLALYSAGSKWPKYLQSARDCAQAQRVFRLLDIDIVRRAIYDRAVVPRLTAGM
jgi:hypothetical protein